MFLQFPEPALGRTRFTRKDSVTLTESFGIGISRSFDVKTECLRMVTPATKTALQGHGISSYSVSSSSVA